MLKGRKRTAAEYDQEIEEAAKRMQKRPEGLRAAKSSSAWRDFLDDIGVSSKILEGESGSKFWEDVRDKMPVRSSGRRNIYKEAREAGMPSKIARRIRDWSPERAEREIDNWKGKY